MTLPKLCFSNIENASKLQCKFFAEIIQYGESDIDNSDFKEGVFYFALMNDASTLMWNDGSKYHFHQVENSTIQKDTTVYVDVVFDRIDLLLHFAHCVNSELTLYYIFGEKAIGAIKSKELKTVLEYEISSYDILPYNVFYPHYHISAYMDMVKKHKNYMVISEDMFKVIFSHREAQLKTWKNYNYG